MRKINEMLRAALLCHTECKDKNQNHIIEASQIMDMKRLLELVDSKRENEMLTVAVFCGNESIVKLLLKNGADVNTLFNGRNLLMRACENGFESIARILVANGADTQFKDPYGCTALMWACRCEHGDPNRCVRFLLNLGANVGVQDDQGRNALMFASEMSDTRTVELLLKYGADLEIKDNDGFTALHYTYYPDTAKLLLRRGASMTVNTKSGQTPLDLVVENTFEELIEVIKQNNTEFYRKRHQMATCKKHNISLSGYESRDTPNDQVIQAYFSSLSCSNPGKKKTKDKISISSLNASTLLDIIDHAKQIKKSTTNLETKLLEKQVQLKNELRMLTETQSLEQEIQRKKNTFFEMEINQLRMVNSYRESQREIHTETLTIDKKRKRKNDSDTEEHLRQRIRLMEGSITVLEKKIETQKQKPSPMKIMFGIFLANKFLKMIFSASYVDFKYFQF